jgi:hypothetical protein
MAFERYSRTLALGVVIVLLFVTRVPSALGQALLPDAPLPSLEPKTIEVQPTLVTREAAEMSHRFWDKKNCVLFATSAALSGADFAVTRWNLQNGGKEYNPLTRILGRSTAALVLNFAGENAGVMGLSYFFHKTGHHKLERAVSIVNIGASVGAVSFGAARR